MSKWKKAGELLNKVLFSQSPKSFFFEFVGSKGAVTIPKKVSHQHLMLCVCKYGSLQGVTKDALCSHKLASISYLVRRESVRK